MSEAPSATSVCALFDELFLATENTRLLAGAEEPVYLPADASGMPARIVFRHDYVASALHEVAHWCIAGTARRTLPDYGYWYAPDGRGPAEQRAFEELEAKPQALEWIFSIACGLPFRPSIDNLDGAALDARGFQARIAREAAHFSRTGLPARAARFRDALAGRFGGGCMPAAGFFAEPAP